MHPGPNNQKLLGALAMPSFLFYWLLVFMYWSAGRDPLSKTWFKLQSAQGSSFECVSIVPKAKGNYPVVVVAASPKNLVAGSGKLFRRVADIGLGVLVFEADPLALSEFDRRVDAVMLHLRGQKWARQDAVGWLGIDDASTPLLAYLSRIQKPATFVQWDTQTGRMEPVPGTHTSARMPSLLPGSSENSTGTARLNANSEAITQATVHRSVAEYYFKNLEMNPQSRSHTPQSQTTVIPGLTVLSGLGLLYGLFLIRNTFNPRQILTLIFRPGKNGSSLMPLSGVAALLAIGATAFHLSLPWLSVNTWSIKLAGRFCMAPADRDDFIHLCETVNWRENRIGIAIANARLCAYNRQLVRWNVSPDYYREFVLSPSITGGPDETYAWRRTLWEHLYPGVKHLKQEEQVAALIPELLRQHLAIVKHLPDEHSVEEILRSRITHERGFALVCVASLRSAGVPARLNADGRAEYFTAGSWQIVPMTDAAPWQTASISLL